MFKKDNTTNVEALRQSVILWTKFLENMDHIQDGLDIGKEILKTADEFKEWLRK